MKEYSCLKIKLFLFWHSAVSQRKSLKSCCPSNFRMMSTRVTEPFGGDIDSTGELTKKPKCTVDRLGWMGLLKKRRT